MGVQKKETRLAASTSTPQLILFFIIFYFILFYFILPSSMVLDSLIPFFFIEYHFLGNKQNVVFFPVSLFQLS